MYFREHARRMRRRQHLKQQLDRHYGTELPKGARIRFNNTKTKGEVVWRGEATEMFEQHVPR